MTKRVAKEYIASRLTFKRDVIEALANDELFRVITAHGTFEMTRADVYAAFPAVVRSQSYRVRGIYHYPSVPKAAEPFRVDE